MRAEMRAGRHVEKTDLRKIGPGDIPGGERQAASQCHFHVRLVALEHGAVMEERSKSEIHGVLLVCSILQAYRATQNRMKTGMMRMATMFTTLIIGLTAGPAVSL